MLTQRKVSPNQNAQTELVLSETNNYCLYFYWHFLWMHAFWKLLESLDWKIILQRFVCEAISQSIRCDTHVTEKNNDICSTDFLRSGQKLDKFEKQRETEIILRNEKLDWLDLPCDHIPSSVWSVHASNFLPDLQQPFS